MLGAENTLRSGHLLLLVLVGSSILLGLSYLNEMYQRIQLQTDFAIVERQIQQAASERSVIQHKATQLKIKLEAADQDKKRLQEMHEFQSQQQSAKYDMEKQELLKNIFIKGNEMAELQGQYESLKVQFDNLHSVMEQFQKNQSRLLEKFTTQSTQCMNVISMMSQLCNKGKKIPLLSFSKQKNTRMTAATSQPSTVTNKPDNFVIPDNFTKSQMTLMQALTENISLPSDGKQRHGNVGPKVINLRSESTGSPEKGEYNATASNVTAQEPQLNFNTQEVMNSTVEPTSGTIQNQSFQHEGKRNDIIKSYKKENVTMQPNTQEKWILDSHKRKQNKFGNVNNTENASEKEGMSQEKQGLQLTTSSHNVTRMAKTNVTQDDVQRIVNLALSETTTQQTSISKTSEKVISKVNSQSTTSSVDNNNKKNDKDENIKEKQGLQLTTSSHNVTRMAKNNVTQEDVQRIVNLALSETTTQRTSISKTSEKVISKVNSQSTTSSVDNNNKKNDKDENIMEEKVKNEEKHLKDSH